MIKESKQAANFLKAELVKADVGYGELCARLNANGAHENYQSVSAKVNRGTFSFIFFVQCMKALNKTKIDLGG